MAVELGAHITAEFSEEFPTWRHLYEYVAAQAAYPEFNADRALHQILAADLTSRLAHSGEWLLLGSLALPTRVPTDLSWPDDLRLDHVTGIDPAYVMARTAFDLDLYATSIASTLIDHSGAEYGQRVAAAVNAVIAPADQPASPIGRGLGGLVAYTPGELRTYPSGQVMGTITAQPIAPRYSARLLHSVDDPITIEIDIKPPSKMAFVGDPEPSTRAVTALTLPGFDPVQPRMYPLADQLADKLCLLTGPPFSLRPTQEGPWHRYKDLIDAYFLVRTCPVSAEALRPALATNWNLARIGHDLPQPYRVYGQTPTPPGEPAVPWREGFERLRLQFPQLERYPDFAGVIAQVGRFVDELADPAAALWTPGLGWTPQPLSRSTSNTYTSFEDLIVRTTETLDAAQSVHHAVTSHSLSPISEECPSDDGPERHEPGLEIG